MTAPTLAALLAGLAAADAERVGLAMLHEDRAASALDDATRRRLVRAALADGTAAAQVLATRCGTRDPAAIAATLDLPVIASDAPARFGSVLRYAEYREQPAEIYLFGTALAVLDAALSDPAHAAFFGLGGAAPALIAHELYHHVEVTDGSPRLPWRHAAVGRLGPLRWCRPLRSLSEIAAGACAQALLGLPRHPKLLDLIALHAHDPAAAARAAGLVVPCAAPNRAA